MEAGVAPGVVVLHPNRDKPESKATKSAVVLLLLVSAALVAIVTFGGWSALQGATPGAIAYILIYLISAYYVGQWQRGLLPVAAALALILGIIAGIAAPSWFDRDKAGFDDPALEPGILGLLTVILVPVQLLLIAFAMRGFQQKWNVEVEVARDEYEGRLPDDYESGYEPVDQAEPTAHPAEDYVPEEEEPRNLDPPPADDPPPGPR